MCLVLLVSACSSQPKSGACEPTMCPPVAEPAAKPNAHGNASVITLVVTMTFKPENEQDFLDVAAKYAAFVHANEPGTVLYVLTKDPDEPHTYVWIERYADEAAIATKASKPEFQEALAKVKMWLAKPPVIKKLTQVVPR
jgi:quinol monooxygenase YgiN